MILSDWISGCLDTKHLTKTKQSKLPKPMQNLKQKKKRPPTGYRYSLTDSVTSAGAGAGWAAAPAAASGLCDQPERDQGCLWLWSLATEQFIQGSLLKERTMPSQSGIIPIAEYSISFLGASGQQTLTINCQRSVFDFTRALSFHQWRRSIPVWRMRSPTGISLLAAQSKIAQPSALGMKYQEQCAF